MNSFPCKNCLVKPCCSEYCNELIKNPRAIDVYVISYTCPDCGEALNFGSSFNKTTIICFSCLKVFSQTAFVKKDFYLEDSNILTSSLGIAKPKTISIPKNNSSYNIIIDVHNLDTSPTTVLEMEESHDVLYYRVNRIEAEYIIRKMKRDIKKKIMKPKTKRISGIKHPTWIDDYEVLLTADFGKKDSPGIIV